MAGTKQFITASVGVQGKNRNADVRALQQLLIAADEKVPGGDDGGWGDNTRNALQSFLRAQTPAVDKAYIEKATVEPTDAVLLKLAEKAQILIPLPGKTGLAGIEAMHTWFVDNKIVYQQGAEDGGGTRCVYGVEGQTGYAVQTESKAFRKGPVQMDCTTYANLMLSVYLYGNAHNTAYDGDCGRVGGTSSFHCARDRYGFQIVTRPDKDRNGKSTTVSDFRTTDQIVAATKDKAGLYALEPARLGSGFVKHLALLWGTTVYECTTAMDPNCSRHRLDEFMDRCKRNGRFCYLFGPKLA
jgi:hypothetical protein